MLASIPFHLRFCSLNVLWVVTLLLCWSNAEMAQCQPTSSKRTRSSLVALLHSTARPTDQFATISGTDAARLESKLAYRIGNLSEHWQLVRWYAYREADDRSPVYRRKLQRELTWIITHHPEAEVAGYATSYISSFLPQVYADDEIQKLVRPLWERQVAQHEHDPRVLQNASVAFVDEAPTIAERLLDKAATYSPRRISYEGIASSYNLLATSGDQVVARRAASKAYRYYRSAAESIRDPHRKMLLNVQAGEAAFQSGRFGEARACALRLRGNAVTTSAITDARYMVYASNMMLGRLSLRAGDAKEAGHYLLAAARLDGPMYWPPFGPDMVLADELLKKGNDTIVRSFLVQSRKFWPPGRLATLQSWVARIDHGETPTLVASFRPERMHDPYQPPRDAHLILITPDPDRR